MCDYMHPKKNINYINNILAILTILLIIFSFITIKSEITSSYEISIYNSLNHIQFFLFFSLFIGVILCTYSIFFKSSSEMDLTTFLKGFYIINFVNIIFLMLPFLKNYYLYGRADNIYHINQINYIYINDFINANNYYPFLHTFIFIFFKICNIPINIITLFMPILFYILFILGIYLLVHLIISNFKIKIITILLSTILLFSTSSTSVTPDSFSYFYFPFLIYLYFTTKIYEKNSIQYKIMFLILIFTYVFLHPITSIILMICILSVEISNNIYIHIIEERGRDFLCLFKINFNILLITSVSWIIWISSFYMWGNQIRTIFDWIKGEMKITGIAEITNPINELEIQANEFIELFIKVYSHKIVIIILAFLVGVHILKTFNKRRIGNEIEFRNIFNVYFIYSCMIILIIVLFLVPYLAFSPTRIMNALLIFSLILSGYYLNIFYNIKIKNKNFIIFITITFLIFLLMINGILTLYKDPYTFSTNKQLTYSEFNSINWLFDNKTLANGNTIYTGVTFNRFNLLSNYNIDYKLGKYDAFPNHFNYDFEENIGEPFNSKNTYFIISKFDEMAYTTRIWKRVDRFNSNDFAKLKEDTTLNIIYTNKNVNIYKGSI